MTESTIDDVRSLDPVGYIRQLGLQPEDSYGFVPMSLDEGASMLYLYRNRPTYEQARTKLAMPDELGALGPVPAGPAQYTPMMHPGGAATSVGGGGKLGDIIEQAQQLQQAYGGAPTTPMGAPGDRMTTPDPEKLVKLAKLMESGAITPDEYARLVAEETGSGPTATPPEPAAKPDGGEGSPIVADRIYPGLRRRVSTRQLNHFMPIYRETVGVRPEDVYGVFPWLLRTSSSEGTSSVEWDDYWIVYRDRPEYAAGREAYAKEMDEKGRWPEPVISPGVGEAPAGASEEGKVEVEKDRWPRKALVMKQTGTELADSLREKIAKWGYEPEDSFGFCPNFPHGSIYFAWRKR